jgi:hypothetical protein
LVEFVEGGCGQERSGTTGSGRLFLQQGRHEYFSEDAGKDRRAMAGEVRQDTANENQKK